MEQPGLSTAFNRLSPSVASRLQLAGIFLIFCGISSMVTVFVSFISGAVIVTTALNKVFYMSPHCMTILFLFAGASVLCMVRLKRTFYLYLSIGLCVVSLGVAVGGFVSDCVNINNIVTARQWGDKRYSINIPKNLPIAVACVDLVLCAIAIGVLVLVFQRIHMLTSALRLTSLSGFRSYWLDGYCLFLILCVFIRLGIWIAIVAWWHQYNARVNYMAYRYTSEFSFEEPAADFSLIFAACMALTGTRTGNKVLIYSSMGLLTVNIYPLFVEIFEDFPTIIWLHWMQTYYTTIEDKTDINTSPDQFGSLRELAEISITISVLIIVVISAILYLQLRLLRNGDSTSQPSSLSIDLKMGRKCKIAIKVCSLLFLFCGITLFAIEMDSLSEDRKVFYRFWFGATRNLPLLAVFCAVLCFFVPRQNASLFKLPVTFASLCLVAQETLAPVLQFIYLSNKKYLYFCSHPRRRQNCLKLLSRGGAWLHFFEVFLCFLLMVTSVGCTFYIGRVMTLYRGRPKHQKNNAIIEPDDATTQSDATVPQSDAINIQTDANNSQTRCWRAAIGIAITGLLLGVLQLVMLYIFGETGRIYMGYNEMNWIDYLLATLPMILSPAIQFLLIPYIVRYPMTTIAILLVSLLRFLSCFLDLSMATVKWNVTYGQSTPPIVGKTLSVFLNFAMACVCMTLLEISQTKADEVVQIEQDMGEANLEYHQDVAE